MATFQHAILGAPEVIDMPSVDAFIREIQSAGKEKRIVDADRVHLNVCNNGLDRHGEICGCLVQMYVGCRSLSSARRVFDRSSSWNEISWAHLVEGYIRLWTPHQHQHQHRHHQHNQPLIQHRHRHHQHNQPLIQHQHHDAHHVALDYIQDLGVRLHHDASFITVLRGCAKFRWIEAGRELHMELAKRSGAPEENLAVATALVDMYAKCGATDEAERVFRCAASRDTVLWTALARGLLERGFAERALDCFDEMASEGLVAPDPVAYACTLKARAILGASPKIGDVHTMIVKAGLESETVAGNALVAAYAKCGLVDEARGVFDKLAADRDVVSWNALINGYVGKGDLEAAICCLNALRHKDDDDDDDDDDDVVVVADSITWIGGLKACSGLCDLRTGRELHAEIVGAALEAELEVGNALMAMYCACGLVDEASEVLESLPVRDVVSWTILGAGYEDAEDVIRCYERMRSEGILPDAPMHVLCLKALGSPAEGLRWHADLVKVGVDSPPQVRIGNGLVEMYMKRGLIAEAEHVFGSMRGWRDTASWNLLLSGYLGHGLCEEAADCIAGMRDERVPPSAYTYAYRLRACSVDDLEEGRAVHSEVIVRGLLEQEEQEEEEEEEEGALLGRSVIHMYMACGEAEDARHVFDRTMMANCKHGDDGLSWAALVGGYARCGLAQQALGCFPEMLERGWGPIPVAVLVGLLTACGDSAALVPGRRVHTSLAGSGPDSTLAHALIDMYCRCGSVAEAESVFFGALAPEAAAAAAAGRWDTVVACNTMLAGYARHGAARRVFGMLDSMLKEGGGGDRITLLNALAACAHCGLVAEAQQLFCSAVLLTGTCAPLGIEHHHCMADLLGRAGRPLEASGTLQRMPFSPDPVTWRTALSASAAACFPFGGAAGASGGGGGIGLSLDAWLENAPSDGPDCSGLLVLMSNILAQQPR